MTQEKQYPAGWLVTEQYHPEEHLMAVRRGADPNYLNVAQRLVWFIRDQRAMIAAGLATTSFIVNVEQVTLDREHGFAEFRAFVRDVLGNEATEVGSESVKDFPDFIEKAATKAKGRALAALGYGTAFAPELDEGERIVDTPRQPQRPPQQPQRPQPQPQRPPLQTVKPQEGEPPASSEQMASIRKLCAALGREEPDPQALTFAGAGALIRQMSKEYNQQRRGGQSA